MSTARRTIAGLAAAAAFASVGLTTTSAHAEGVTVRDGGDATASPTDIHRVRVEHRERGVMVRVKFADLQRYGGASLSIMIDTVARRRGPEIALFTSTAMEADSELARMRNWRDAGTAPECWHLVRKNYPAEVLTFKLATSCLGNPARVRASVRMTDRADASHPITDWAPGRRTFTRWLAPA